MGKKTICIDDSNQILPMLMSDVIHIMNNEVADTIHQMIADEYDDTVYSYNASGLYSRRGSLTDPNNMMDSIDVNGNVVTLEVSHTARPNTPLIDGYTLDNNANLADWIEDGDIPNIFDRTKTYPWESPRPVLKTVQNKVDKSQEIDNIIAQTLKQAGYDVV